MQQSAAKLARTHTMLFAAEAFGSVSDSGQHGLAYITPHIYIKHVVYITYITCTSIYKGKH